MYLPVVCVIPRKTVWHKLAKEAGGQGEGGQQGGARRGGEVTLQIGVNLDSAQEEEHLPAGPHQMQVSASLQKRGHRRVQVAVH